MLKLKQLREQTIEGKTYIEGRYWGGHSAVAIVAVVTEGVDWAAYIGGDESRSEMDTVAYAATYGAKLSRKDARHFFPDIKLPYRE